MTPSTDTPNRAGNADAFRRLHVPGRPVLIANAWDAGSARLIESCGGAAIATTSAGLAWARGYPDGDALPPAILAAAVAEIARVIDVPLSVDAEGGYSDLPARVGEVVRAIVDAGGIGINIEDGSSGPDLLVAKIAAARTAAARAGVGLFINARTDVYLRSLVEPTLRSTRRSHGRLGTAMPAPTACSFRRPPIPTLSAGSPPTPACR